MAATEKYHRLASLFIDNRHLLGLTIIILLVAGLSALLNLPRIEDPRITNRNPFILSFLPGASTARIEALVTKPLEDELREIAEIKKIESTSRPNISLISVELEDRIGPADNERVFSLIRDRLADAALALPAGASQPVFDDKRGAVAYSLVAAVQWQTEEGLRLGVLTRLAEELADRLRTLPGTEHVKLFGDAREEITVIVEPGEVAALGLTVTDLAALIAAADVKLPAGVLRTRDRNILLEVAGGFDSVQRIAAIPVAENPSGAVVTLGDIARVSKHWQAPPEALAQADGARAVLVAARVEPQAHVDRWAEAAHAAVADLAQTVSSPIAVEVIFDQSRYTEERLAGLGGNLLAGAGVVVLVVLIGMGWRAALIVGLALPLSAAFTLFGLTFFGQQIHQMTIFGMIIAIGLLIDTAIVITDEIRKQLNAGLSPVPAMTTAVGHLFTPLVASTLTTVLGFMPIFLLSGNVGDFVGPIAISVVLALIGSFLISMTVIAALAALFLKSNNDTETWWRSGIANRKVTEYYRRSLLDAVNRPRSTMMLTLILPALGFALATTLGTQFFPPADRDQFEVEVWLDGDASLERTTATIRDIEAVIRSYETVERVDWLVGESYPTVYYNLVMDKDNQPFYAHGIIRGRNIEAVNALLPVLQTELDRRFPQAQVVISAFGQGPPSAAPVAFRIVGPAVAELKRLGEELRQIMHTVPDILHTQASIDGGEPKLWFEADENKTRLAGLTLQAVAGQLQSKLEGQVGGAVLEDLEELPVRVRYDNSQRASLNHISTLELVTTASRDAWIPATALGEFTLRPEPGSITRRDGRRVNEVLGFVTQSALPIEVTDTVLARLEENGFELPPGYRLEIAGGSEEQGRAIAQLLTYVSVLVTLMIATVILSFRSVVLAGLIGAVAVLSVGLGLLSLWLSGFPLGFNPILGSAGLVGVAINGTIVVLAAIRANPEARRGDAVAIVDETLGTTRHILSTTLTTIGGFLPLLLFTGGEFWPPLAVVIAGGVGFSVTLSLLLTPAAYHLLYGRRVRTPWLSGFHRTKAPVTFEK